VRDRHDYFDVDVDLVLGCGGKGVADTQAAAQRAIETRRLPRYGEPYHK